MSVSTQLRTFRPRDPDSTGIISWVHIGDLHMTRAGEHNHLDLAAVVDEINRCYAESISFVYLPGDIADDGSATAYRVVREELDRLNAPWCSIIGDHDVHEKGFVNYRAAMLQETHYAFEAGAVRFLALNAFDVPDPRSFAMLPPQLDWINRELEGAGGAGQTVVLFLHCYPTDLKQGGDQLQRLLRGSNVRLIEMGHTHYNEVANDGEILYAATRSTGQIEEGPVGYSITNIDGEAISWKFVPLGELPVLMITSPADERFLTASIAERTVVGRNFTVRVKAWSRSAILRVTAKFEGETISLQQTGASVVWQGQFKKAAIPDGTYELAAFLQDADGRTAEDRIRIVAGKYTPPERAPRDQDNALEAWPERGLLGTQLGPNKNGRKC